ncbi:methylated-DNA-[protein]-cysteine S-methyltransferase [Micromonospora haikouensis]|uniref:Methylated-DNA--protein-cysteine methyltransferase n=1 Tax=Micromonospora haikouensis TaxID=686309 RepID=A0A1C4UFX6_9ACTN|nr:methylated-DNA--[protein]-cysteine S-methyltransferase [Micromonospora haikouensis]SCE70589.1 methylated-DNA-[protein]-cysteine S-methyltransferase [Micromonospora haikouensis]
MRWTVLDSPIGEFSVATDDDAVCGTHFGRVETAVDVPGDELSGRAVAELRAYFAGELTGFTVPVAVRRGSEFERAVWREMARIPYGETSTYGEVARLVGGGDPGAARAVGVACNRNPIPVIVPCHRIVGAGAKLVGFGGGLPRKVKLLELEAGVALRRAWS